MNKKGFYAAIYSFAGIMIVLAVVFSTVKKSNPTEPEEGNSLMSNETQTELSGNSSLYLDDYYSDYDEIEDSAVNASSDKKISETTTSAPKAETTTSPTGTASKEPTTQPQTTQSQTDNSTAQFSLFDDTQEMIWPVNGKIVMDYSMETAVYDKTLDQYRTNDSLCIAAEVGTPVCAAAEGIVENIYHDHNKGNCIVVNHGNGWLSTYGQLQTETSVTVGELVKAGTELGKVAESTAAESLLGPHLSFAVSKDNVPDDPKLILAQLDE